MKKSLIVLGSILTLLVVGGLFTYRMEAELIVTGHTSDIVGRLTDDRSVVGNTIAQGMFREDDRGQDTFHAGGGSVSILSTDSGNVVQLQSDFWTTPGPDYHVYVSTVRGIVDEDAFNRATVVELGKLTKGSGASFYEIPEGLEVNSVTIWCKRFGEFIASADIS